MNNYRIKTELFQNDTDEIKNFNNIINGINLVDETEFEFIEKNKKVVNMSIQAQPGFLFYINDNDNPIIIGSNGIFSWEIKNLNTYIWSVKIKKDGNDWPLINPRSTIIITYEYIESVEE